MPTTPHRSVIAAGARAQAQGQRGGRGMPTSAELAERRRIAGLSPAEREHLHADAPASAGCDHARLRACRVCDLVYCATCGRKYRAIVGIEAPTA